MYCTAISQHSLKLAFGLAKVTNGDGPNDKGKRPAGLKPGDAGILFTDGLETADDFAAIANGSTALTKFFGKAPKAVINTPLSLPNKPTPLMRLVSTNAISNKQKTDIMNGIARGAIGKIDFAAKDAQGKTVFDHAYAQGYEMFYNTAMLLIRKPIATITFADVESTVGTTSPARHVQDTRRILREILGADVYMDTEYGADLVVSQETANRTALLRAAAIEAVRHVPLNRDHRHENFLEGGHLVGVPNVHASLRVDDPTFCHIVKNWPLFKQCIEIPQLLGNETYMPSLKDRMKRLGLLQTKKK